MKFFDTPADSFWDILLKMMLYDWPMGTLVGVILIIATLGCVAIVGYGLFVAFDSWYLPRQKGVGRITGKTFTPAETHINYWAYTTTGGFMLLPSSQSEDYSLTVHIGDESDFISVNEKFFRSVSKGDLVATEYVRGRISGWMYLKECSKV